jgi:hypothetical protein
MYYVFVTCRTVSYSMGFLERVCQHIYKIRGKFLVRWFSQSCSMGTLSPDELDLCRFVLQQGFYLFFVLSCCCTINIQFRRRRRRRIRLLTPTYKVVLDYLRYLGMWYSWSSRNGFLFAGLSGVSQHICRIKGQLVWQFSQ